MKDNTKLLEERVASAVERLKQLSEDRNRLETEVRTLQTRLASAEREQSARADASPAADGAFDGWLEQRAMIMETLRETIGELRSD